MNRLIGALVLAAGTLPFAGEAYATGYPWTNHAAPYDFVFGNDIDSHQQMRTTKDGGVSGFFYIHYTGDVTSDGLRVATHDDCAAVACDVGWLLRGERAMGAFQYQVDGDHPVWLVDRRDIPQPGAYAHFHWVGGGTPSTMIKGDVRNGYLLELQAVNAFCFVHHGTPIATGTCEDRGGIVVTPGVDIASHVNIVGSAAPSM